MPIWRNVSDSKIRGKREWLRHFRSFSALLIVQRPQQTYINIRNKDEMDDDSTAAKGRIKRERDEEEWGEERGQMANVVGLYLFWSIR